MNNIVFKCKYYKTIEKYDETKHADKIKKREFLSCNASYNYVSYVDTGSINKLPNDYTEYIGDKEKSVGVFNKYGLMTEDEKQKLKEQLKKTKSCIWDCVISFETEFGKEYCRDYDQAFNFISKELPKFFTRAGLNKDNMIWYAGLHENTEHNHIHLSFFEREPMYYANGGKLKYHSGPIKRDILIESREKFEIALTNKSAEIVRCRKNLEREYNVFKSSKDLLYSIKKRLLSLYDKLPPDGRLSYDSDNMRSIKKDVDGVTEYILQHNHKTREEYHKFKYTLNKLQEWKTENYGTSANIYHEDLMRRLGNKTIQIALSLGKSREQIKQANTNNTTSRMIRKNCRKSMLDELLNLMEYNAKITEQELKNFEYYYNMLERLRTQNEYEGNRSKFKEYDYEM